MTKLLVATHNQNKIKEIREILADLEVDLVTLSDLDETDEVIEDGDSFKANALLKASYFAQKYQMMCIADDSGLVIKSLEGRPGIYSARYANGNDQDNNYKVLREMENIEDRSAYFICVIVLSYPSGAYLSYEGRAKGEITYQQKGCSGFGYDPIFYSPVYKKNFSELTTAQKNKISHRGQALRQFKENLDEIITN